MYGLCGFTYIYPGHFNAADMPSRPPLFLLRQFIMICEGVAIGLEENMFPHRVRAEWDVIFLVLRVGTDINGDPVLDSVRARMQHLCWENVKYEGIRVGREPLCSLAGDDTIR